MVVLNELWNAVGYLHIALGLIRQRDLDFIRAVPICGPVMVVCVNCSIPKLLPSQKTRFVPVVDQGMPVFVGSKAA